MNGSNSSKTYEKLPAVHFDLVERLDFTLPDFTRISWVSDGARATWEPRFRQIAQAWHDVEWLAIVEGVRECSLTRMSPQGMIEAGVRWSAHGLSAIPLQMEGLSKLPYASTTPALQPGEPLGLSIVVGHPATLVRFQEAWQARDNFAIGDLLGYPKCCQQFFQAVWVDAHCVDTTWAMAANSQEGGAAGRVTVEPAGSIYANILWRWMGVRAVPHLPCSFACPGTVEFGKRMLQVGRSVGYAAEMDWIEEILSWPAEWSALHGIAEIKTPILKVSTRTDATPARYTVAWPGVHYPAEGATGLKFPYQSAGRRIISDSAGFRRGLKNPIRLFDKLPVEEEPWYYRDNGFSSRATMDSLHEPIVALARRALTGRQGNVIDLGCGNGALVRKICAGAPDLVAYGIDLNAQAILHAKERFPQAEDRLIQGDFFAPETWNHSRRYCLGLLMIGRLLEVSEEKATQLKQILRRRCDLLLVYLYPGWSNTPFEQLVAQAQLALQETDGHRVGLVDLQALA